VTLPDPKGLTNAALKRMIQTSKGSIALQDYRVRLVLELSSRRRKR